MNLKRTLILLLTAVGILLAPMAKADYVVLRSGQRLHITGYLQQGANVLLYVSGGEVVVPSADIARFEPEDIFPLATHATELNVPFSKQILSAAAQNGVDGKLISSVISAESNFQPRAVSSKQARGLMQLMPRTAAHYSVRNAFDPAQNISAGTRYLKLLLDQYHGNLALALAAYNAGPQRVSEYGGVPPFPETRDYIRRVTATLQKLKTGAERAAPPSQ